VKILWHSNAPWAATGYGAQTALFTPRINAIDGYNVDISAFWGLMGNVLGWNGMEVYPTGIAPYGNDVMYLHARAAGADALLTLIDAWVMNADPEGRMPWVPWFPVDHDPVPPMVLERAREATIGITMSRHGQQAMADAGVETLYMPHAFSRQFFHPDPEQRDAARAWMGLPDDAFLFGMVAANKGGYPSRKSIPQVLEAFARIAADHPTAYLYLHTEVGGLMQGVNVADMLVRLGIADRVKAADQYRSICGLMNADFMRGIYNALDVLVNPSMGEGFGVPILEAQACGCPVIVGDWTAMGELCFSGWKLDRESEAERFWTAQGANQYLPHVDALAEAMGQAIVMAREPDVRDLAYRAAQAYEIDTVMERFCVPVLAEIERRIRPVARVASVAVEAGA
jgi:glycosyltransferase involved in cell wall biosynthesis